MCPEFPLFRRIGQTLAGIPSLALVTLIAGAGAPGSIGFTRGVNLRVGPRVHCRPRMRRSVEALIWHGNLLQQALRAVGTVVPIDGRIDARSQAMDTISTSLLVAACIFAGGVGGLYLHRLLPRTHLTRET